MEKQIRIKPVGSSEIKDINIVRAIISEIRREKSPNELQRIEARSNERIAFLHRAMS